MKNLMLLLICLFMVVPSQARIITVDDDGPADFVAIQAAIDDSNDGDILVVGPGIYSKINFNGKNITVVSSNPDDPNIVATTIIDAGGTGTAVTFANGEGPDAVLTGFTITGGYGTVNAAFEDIIYWGGGVYCEIASPTITGNVIAGNHGPVEIVGDDPENWKLGYGGGIGCLESNAIVSRNIIKDNTAYAGAGIMVWVSDDAVTSNLIYDNSAEIGGGVILLYGGRLINNTVVANSAPTAGNVYAGSDAELAECLILSNIICNAVNGAGVYQEGLVEYDTIRYNNVWGNVGGDYLDWPDQTGINGNISEDPLFVSEGSGDYHLQSSSLCINSGDPAFVAGPGETDIDSESRIYAARVDIGADEYVGYINPVADAGDDQYLDAIELVSLDGSGSFFHDPCGVKQFQWTQSGGPSVTLSDPCVVQPSFTPVLEAEYSFELVVGDGINVSLPDTVVVVVGNRSPVADAGDDVSCQAGVQVILDGSGSYDPDPVDKLTYSWSQLQGPSVVLYDSNSASPYFDCAEAGTYEFELVVSDGLAQSGPDTVMVTARIGSEPDAYGYRWIDSDNPYGPQYNWIDIEGTGTRAPAMSDDDYVGPFALGFDLDFYGNIYSQFYIQSNGAITFEGDYLTFGNNEIPSADGRDNMLAWMWDDLDGSGSTVYYQNFAGYTVVQFVDYNHLHGGSLNAEVIIYRSGRILFQYQDFTFDVPLGSCTIGIENADGTIGTQVIYNDSDYLHGELAIEFDFGPPYKPIASAGTDQMYGSAFLPTVVTLDGSGSYDLDPCDTIEYHWRQISGPIVGLSDPNAMNPSFAPLEFGTYVFELVVNDGTYDSIPDTVNVVIENQLPVANAGPDQSTESLVPLIMLDGGGSSDPSDDPLSYHWRQISGPVVVLDGANSVSPTFEPPQLGAYVFELVVSDSFLESMTDTVNVVVGVSHIPVADAGSSRYGANGLRLLVNGEYYRVPDYVVLNGSGSYDPDASGPLSYRWRQISGPSMIISDANNPNPRISDIVHTDSIQVSEFELIVNDGDFNSLPDVVEVIVALAPNASEMVLENEAFDPSKPTTIYFAGSGDPWSEGDWDDTYWKELANVISFSEYYWEGDYNYARCADMITAYLSSVAPDYNLSIQVMGGSGGGRPSPSVAINMNRHKDPRYAVNRLGFFDCVWHSNINELVQQFYASRIDGETCWVENYVSLISRFLPGVLNVGFETEDHGQAQGWYRETTNPALTPFNGGVVAGVYWSILGPGKNLQLAYTNDMTYLFYWYGTRTTGYMVMHEDCTVCGRLPEPVTLHAWGDANAAGLVLSCEESQNAVGYQLLMGPDPDRVGHYEIIADTPHPPNEVITSLPFEKTYWTIRAYDNYGSTIYADPIYIDARVLSGPVVNLTTGRKYAWIQDAIYQASDGDEIVVSPGTYYENINFYGKDVLVRSSDPTDPSVVAATVINGGHRGPAVTFGSGEGPSCMLRGFTIEGAAVTKDNSADPNPTRPDMGTGGGAIACFDLFRVGPVISDCVVTGNDCAGLYCYRSGPTVINCTFAGNDSNGVELQGRSLAKFINCAIVDNSKYGVSGGYPTATNCTIVGNALSAIASYAPKISNCILWDNASGDGDEQGEQIMDLHGSGWATYSNVQGGWEGEGNIDADPCFVSWGYWDADGVWTEGDYHLQPGSPCIDAADNTAIPPDQWDFDGDGNTTEPITSWDLDANPRFIDYPSVPDTGSGTAPIVDMGAYEAYLPPIEVWMKFTPQSLNPGSNGNWVKAHFVLPDGFSVDDVDANTPVEIEQLGIESHYMNVFVNEDGLVEVEAGFDRSEFCNATRGGEVMEITVIGFFTDGRRFSGKDTVRILDKTMERLAALASHWLEFGCGAPDWCGGSDINRDSVVNFLDFARVDSCCIELVSE